MKNFLHVDDLNSNELNELLEKEDSTLCGYLCASEEEYHKLKKNPDIEYIPSFSKSFNHKDISCSNVI